MIDIINVMAPMMVIGVPFLIMLLIAPPKNRLWYTIYSFIVGICGSFIIYICYAHDALVRGWFSAGIKSDIVVQNIAQVFVVISAMVYGGISANLFVAGLQFDWKSPVPLKNSTKKLNETVLRIALEHCEGCAKLIPSDSARQAYIYDYINSDAIQNWLSCVEDSDFQIYAIDEFKKLMPIKNAEIITDHTL